jgi:two-component system NarL family sensor kinase
LGSAARWYVDGFAQRSGIKVNLDLGPDSGRLDEDAEIALFRTMQEALTNVHRHAVASTVEICLAVTDQEIRLEIRDDGRGIPVKRPPRISVLPIRWIRAVLFRSTISDTLRK